MSRQDSTKTQRGIAEETPKADIYTAMLGVSLVALIVAVVLMAMEWGRYGPIEDARRANVQASLNQPADGLHAHTIHIA